MKVYVQPGQFIELHLASAVVGLSRSCVDLHIDWKSTNENGGNEGIGSIIPDPDSDRVLTYNLFVDKKNGQLWYDDEYGF